MAIRNTVLGGTNWASEGVSSSDLNDTFDATVNHLVSFGRAAQFTTSATSWQLVTSGVISAVSGSIVTGMTIDCSSSNNQSTMSAYTLLLLSGANLGQKCYDSFNSYLDYGAGLTRTACYISTDSSSAITLRMKSTANTRQTQFSGWPVELKDANTTASVYLRSEAANGTSSIAALTYSVFYVRKGKVE